MVQDLQKQSYIDDNIKMRIYPPINYLLIAKAIEYYVQNGYKYIEVPWVVSSEALNITCPKIYKMRFKDKSTVYSGEQSFLQMILDYKLMPGKYVCATPCFRPGDETVSNLHFNTFFKVELINFLGRACLGDQDTNKLLDEMVNTCQSFYKSVLDNPNLFSDKMDIHVEKTKDEERHLCMTLSSCDIVTNDDIEIGSYGVRLTNDPTEKSILWIYGTGLALPRFTLATSLRKEFHLSYCK